MSLRTCPRNIRRVSPESSWPGLLPERSIGPCPAVCLLASRRSRGSQTDGGATSGKRPGQLFTTSNLWTSSTALRITHSIILTITFLLGLVSSAWAHPPYKMELNYDQEKKNLHIEITHITHDPREHHIRKVLITQNDNEPVIRYFATQTTPSTLILDIPWEAKQNDVIRVKAICSEGGQKEETLVVP